VPDKENDMVEDDPRPVNVIRADLAGAMDLLAALRSDHVGGAVHFFVRSRVKVPSDEICVAEDAAERLAQASDNVSVRVLGRAARRQTSATPDRFALPCRRSTQTTPPSAGTIDAKEVDRLRRTSC
jgi:hypothetical protein